MEKIYSFTIDLNQSEFCEMMGVFMGVYGNMDIPDEIPLKSGAKKFIAAGSAVADNKTLIYLDQVKRAMMNVIKQNPDASESVGIGMIELLEGMPALKMPDPE